MDDALPITIRIRGVLGQLQPAVRKVGEFIVENPSRAAAMTISALASETGVSEATVVRLAREVGVAGHADLRLQLASEVGSRSKVDAAFEGSTDVSPDDDLRSAVEKIAYIDQRSVVDTLRGLSLESVAQVVDAMEEADRIFIFGVGASGLVAQDLAQKLQRVGKPAIAYFDAHTALVAAAVVNQDCLAIGVSNSGATTDTLDIMREAHRRGATTVAITNAPRSKLARLVDYVLVTAAMESRFRAGSTGSRLAQLALVDCLYVGFAQQTFERSQHALNVTRDVVASRHEDTFNG